MIRLKEIMMAMLSMCLLAACSSDDETTGFDEYDAEYQIRYYTRPPYANLEQGYWYKDDAKKVFFKLTPNTKAPSTHGGEKRWRLIECIWSSTLL